MVDGEWAFTREDGAGAVGAGGEKTVNVIAPPWKEDDSEGRWVGR